MEFHFPADPDVDTVAAVAENARTHIISRLRSAVEILETKSSKSLLYGDEPASVFALGY